MRVLIVVTHLLGTGHLRRAATLARAFAGAGHETVLASGGFPMPGVDMGAARFEQLPPVASDGVDFTRLLGAGGGPVGPVFLQARRARLLEVARAAAPDVLITELYPFGRRVLAAEFDALLQARLARVTLASVRDILAPPSKPAKARVAAERIGAFYDGVLVHSDARAVPLEASWPVDDTLAAKLRYTGFVAPPPPKAAPEGAGKGEVLVSAGGGAVGDALFRAAVAAAEGSPLTWRLLVGGTDPAPRIARLAAGATANVIAEPARPDFRSLLTRAAVSVSMCGYNTALDLLQTGCPAVLVPFDDGAEVEQTLRAQSLAKLPGFALLRQAELSGDALARAAGEMARTPRRGPSDFAMDGAAQSVAIAERMAAG